LPSSTNAGEKLPYPPWKQILSSIPVWALTISYSGSAFSLYMIQTEIPTYLGTIQHFNLATVKLPFLLKK